MSNQSLEGRLAKRIAECLANVTFNPAIFAYILTTANQSLHKQIMSLAKNIILAMADRYEAGVIDDSTTDAMRLRDTMNLYDMQG